MNINENFNGLVILVKKDVNVLVIIRDVVLILCFGSVLW